MMSTSHLDARFGLSGPSCFRNSRAVFKIMERGYCVESRMSMMLSRSIAPWTI